MGSTLRWGIMGTGNIARQFAAGLGAARRGTIQSIGSRSADSARSFAAKFPGEAHGSYDALLADRNVDAIYLSLPNSMHHEWTIKSLKAGKHVLCEKPIASSAAQAEEMFDVAQKAGKVLVEAFMYRSHPQTAKILETIKSGVIGQVKLIKTSFCYRTTKIEGNIRFSRELHGGAVMDVGCYCVNLSRLIAGGEPDRVLAAGKLFETGVDEWSGGTLHFPNGIIGSFVCGMTVQADNSAFICGTDGYLQIGWPWKPQPQATFTVAHSVPPRQDSSTSTAGTRPPREDITVEAGRELYAFEADDFAATVLDGAAPALSRQDTVGNMRVLDQIRQQVGLQF